MFFCICVTLCWGEALKMGAFLFFFSFFRMGERFMPFFFSLRFYAKVVAFCSALFLVNKTKQQYLGTF